jgi:D-3-phosphoglycerate dehydrogenase
MSRPLVVFTDDTVHPAAAEKLRETCELRILPGSYPDEALLAETCAGASAILARMGVVTRKVIESSPRLRIIARHGIGVDAVDLDAATEHGIPVTTTGSINAGAVAEYAFAMLLGLARKIPEAHDSMRRGAWSRENLIGYELAGKTMGIIGLGAIGTFVARQALGFRMKVVAQDPVARPPADLDIEMTDREDLLRRSDVVSLHMRLTEDTRRTLDATSIAKLKPGVLVVNTARGELIHEAALIDGLNSGHIGGAAIDVYEQEPLPADSPLRSMPNVLLSPHVAAQTEESRKLVAIAAAEAILEAIAGRRPKYVYNPAAYEAARKPAASAV